MLHPGEAASLTGRSGPCGPVRPVSWRDACEPPPGPRRPAATCSAALWRLLGGERTARTPTAFLALLDDAADAFAESTEPRWVAWRHALAARRALIESDPDAAAADVAAAREALDKCPPSADTALAMAYLAHVEVAADHFDAAMLLAVDASLLTEGAGGRRALPRAAAGAPLAVPGPRPASTSRSWRSPTPMRGQHVAAALREPERPVADAAAVGPAAHRAGPDAAPPRRRSTAPASSPSRRSPAPSPARELDWEPEPAEADLLDVVQAWALTCADDLDGALGPLRRVRRHVEAEGGLWLRGYTGLALARLLARLAERDGDDESGEEAIGLLVDAAGAFAAAGDRRRYRQCLLELGQHSADLGRPAEALHWLEAYRADTGRAHARGRELWAEMFVRRSRLREAERQAALLRRHALEDPLTGLGNRRSAERRLGAMRLGEEPLSLAVVDVDRFKEVNDEASHTHGRRRPAPGRRPAARAQPHRRRGLPLGRRRVPRRPADGDRGAGRRRHGAAARRRRRAPTGATCSSPSPVTVSIGVATRPAAGEGEPDRRRLAGAVRHRRPAPVLRQAQRAQPGPRARRRRARSRG